MRLAINGIQLDFMFADGALGWMSDWCQVDRLANQGYLSRVGHGPATYGHTSFYATEKLIAEASLWTERNV